MDAKTNIISIISTEEFLSLSAHLNYQLSADPIDWRAVLALMHSELLNSEDEDLIIETLEYLGNAYKQKRRVLGPFAVLHPIRAAALLSRSAGKAIPLNVLTTLLHDKNEDITKDKYSKDDWKMLEKRYDILMEKMDDRSNWFLNERIQFLSRDRDETYREYLISLITRATATPELLGVKLADRLDNTLDLRMDLYEDKAVEDPYQYIFNVLFCSAASAKKLKLLRHIDRKIKGAKRLYELYKSAVFLSLLNSEKIDFDESTQQLYNSLAIASLNEANKIMLHIFTYHLTDAEKQKALLLDVMDYGSTGGLRKITTEKDHMLDGLFRGYFESNNKAQIKENLKRLYRNKELMAQAAVAFSAIFTNFLNDREFSIEGI